jgi:RimJ/RimL family protein N-acetyltransferase
VAGWPGEASGGRRDVQKPRVLVSELEETDLPFLLDLWQIPEVMRYADELPWLRGWDKTDDPRVAWRRYLERRAELGPEYTQLILRLPDGIQIGESFIAPLPEGYTFGRWEKPARVPAVMADIKLLPEYWGQGLGTEGMQRVVDWVFRNTAVELFVVPPHRHNPAAERVYEKAGFVRYTGMRSWHNHRIMELTRQRFEAAHGQ